MVPVRAPTGPHDRASAVANNAIAALLYMVVLRVVAVASLGTRRLSGRGSGFPAYVHSARCSGPRFPIRSTRWPGAFAQPIDLRVLHDPWRIRLVQQLQHCAAD